ncbi:MAG TPA: hypothetical protein PLV00_07225 [Caldisericia bacterium]|nr:hypothetical protein [Caldisericia bacterium]
MTRSHKDCMEDAQGNKDMIKNISTNQLIEFLRPYHLTMNIEQEEDGSYTGFLKEIDLACNARTPAEVKMQLAKDLWSYALEYMADFKMYYHSLNRKSHYPYVMHVLLQTDIKDVQKIIREDVCE